MKNVHPLLKNYISIYANMTQAFNFTLCIIYFLGQIVKVGCNAVKIPICKDNYLLVYAYY